jgi:hypothetical protein
MEWQTEQQDYDFDCRKEPPKNQQSRKWKKCSAEFDSRQTAKLHSVHSAIHQLLFILATSSRSKLSFQMSFESWCLSQPKAFLVLLVR